MVKTTKLGCLEKYKKQKHLLTQREEANAFRVLRSLPNHIDFSSNDYLSLAKKSENITTSNSVSLKNGSGGSRLLAGNYSEIEDFEKRIAAFHQVEAALVFNSGYNANIGFFSAVPQKGDTIIYDELIHASIKDGMRLSFAKSYAFKHNDLQDLKRKVARAEGDVYVAIEAIYSMDGDAAPLVDISNFCREVGATLVVDEAHSVGVFGEQGQGLVQALNLQKLVPVRIVTFGKAVGAHGAAVLSCNLIKHFLVNFSRSFIYTTALPPHSVAVLNNAYNALQQGLLTRTIQDKIQFFVKIFNANEALQNSANYLIGSNSAIQCVLFSGNTTVKAVAENLQQQGFDVRPVLSPTVKIGKERIRICLHIHNTNQQITDLVKALHIEIAKIRD